MRLALDAINNPCKEIPAIQVAGTNGKGSISSFIKSTLVLSGIKVGVTTSPHLVSWCERIAVNDENISEAELKRILELVKSQTDLYKLTPFELIICAALKYFEEEKVQLLILEVGMGGRLDATTIHPCRPIIAMGRIGLDHCEYLGDNLSQIAKEKSAIINQSSVVISACQNKLVKEIMEQEAFNKKSKIKWVDPLSASWDLGIPGSVQRYNAAVAKVALESLSNLGYHINQSQIRKGLKNAYWPGRLEYVYWKNLPLLIDCAHNPLGVKQLSEERLNWANQSMGVIWIIGIQSHKDGQTMIKHLLQPNDVAWIIPVPNSSSWTKSKLVRNNPYLAEQIFEADSAEKVFSNINSQQDWPTTPPIVTGSIYIIGDLLASKIISKQKHNQI